MNQLEIMKNLYITSGVSIDLINFFGFRNAEKQKEDTWNDRIGYFTSNEIGIYKGTTDPGIYWTMNPENTAGAAHLCLGYHKNIWVIDKHKGLYTALCNKWNCNPTRIWRDTDKDTVQDLNDKLETGRFGINLHRASSLFLLESIGKYSAGCQVVQDAKNFDIIMNKAVESGLKKFSYFLFSKNQISFFEELS